MSLEGQMTPENLPNFHMTVVLVHVKRRKKLKAVRGSYLTFVIKHALFPSRNHEPSSELLRFMRGVRPNFRQASQFLYHIILAA